jgi:uncharacterized protein YacL
MVPPIRKETVKRLEHVSQESPVFLVLAQPSGLLVGRFVSQLVEILITFPLVLSRSKLPIVFHELLEASAIDENHSTDVDIFRFHLPKRSGADPHRAPYTCNDHAPPQLRSVASTDGPTI